MMQLALLTAQMLTRQSSPPVASRRPELFPRARQETEREWASNSSGQREGRDSSAAGCCTSYYDGGLYSRSRHEILVVQAAAILVTLGDGL